MRVNVCICSHLVKYFLITRQNNRLIDGTQESIWLHESAIVGYPLCSAENFLSTYRYPFENRALTRLVSSRNFS